MSRVENIFSGVMGLLASRGLEPDCAPCDDMVREHHHALISRNALMVRAGAQKYVCATITDNELLNDAATGDREKLYSYGRQMSFMLNPSRGELAPTILLDFDETLPYSDRVLSNIRHTLEANLSAFVLVRDPRETVEDLLERVPGLFSMPIRDWSNPAWQEHIGVTNNARIPDTIIEFGNAPGLAVLEGGNGSGKTSLIHQFAATGMGDKTNFPTMMGAAYQQCDEALMRAYRRVIGYGQSDGSLLMPIQYEGESTLRLDRIVSAIIACSQADSQSRWPGLMLDTPLSGVGELQRFKLTEIIARLALERQVLVTCRESNTAYLLEVLANAHGAACGRGKLDFSSRAITINVEKKPVPAPVPEQAPSTPAFKA